MMAIKSFHLTPLAFLEYSIGFHVEMGHLKNGAFIFHKVYLVIPPMGSKIRRMVSTTVSFVSISQLLTLDWAPD
jgi:hypothetical protein